jgi:DNA polymerase I-like protein with 3'-5' exonuclease and polymerase domains
MVIQEMTNASKLNVPLEVNVGVGKSWGEAAH